MTQLKDVVWSQTGFDDLKKYCHKNNEFLRGVNSLFHERVRLEQMYADGLTKIATKARKMCAETLGTLRATWEEFSTQTDLEVAVHKSLSTDVMEQIVKSLKIFLDSQKEERKTAEQAVEKSAKALAEKRAKEAQAKKSSYSKAKESEHSTVQLESSRGKTLSEKELSKLDVKCKKAEENVVKSDKDYINKLIDAERARLNLDSSVTSSTMIFQKLEEEKLVHFKTILLKYSSLIINSIPKINECLQTLEKNAQCMDVNADIQTLIETCGSKRQTAEQIIYSCYEEDMSNTMDLTRRKLALEGKKEKLLKILNGEKKAKTGLTRLNSVYSDNPSYSTKNTNQDVGFQLGHSKSVIDLLEASVYRLNLSLTNLGQREPPTHRLAPHITTRNDKQGVLCCTLKVPLDGMNSLNDDDDNDGDYMPAGDYYSTYGSLTYDDDDDDVDEFDDVDNEFDDMTDAAPPGYSTIDMCKADYEYVATENDELAIKVGDVITVIHRHDDGWWKGELRGKIGLFPSSYVHELR